MCLHLARKELVIAIIIADRSQDRRIRRQCNRRQAGPVKSKTAGKFTRDVLRISGAATVPGKQNLATVAQCRNASLCRRLHARSEEHTSELQSLMRISYAVFCLKKNT